MRSTTCPSPPPTTSCSLPISISRRASDGAVLERASQRGRARRRTARRRPRLAGTSTRARPARAIPPCSIRQTTSSRPPDLDVEVAETVRRPVELEDGRTVEAVDALVFARRPSSRRSIERSRPERNEVAPRGVEPLHADSKSAALSTELRGPEASLETREPRLDRPGSRLRVEGGLRGVTPSGRRRGWRVPPSRSRPRSRDR